MEAVLSCCFTQLHIFPADHLWSKMTRATNKLVMSVRLSSAAHFSIFWLGRSDHSTVELQMWAMQITHTFSTSVFASFWHQKSVLFSLWKREAVFLFLGAFVCLTSAGIDLCCFIIWLYLHWVYLIQINTTTITASVKIEIFIQIFF